MSYQSLTAPQDIEGRQFTHDPRMLYYFLGVMFIMGLSLLVINFTESRPRINAIGYAHLAGCIAGAFPSTLTAPHPFVCIQARPNSS